jgi:hypothetical protein
MDLSEKLFLKFSEEIKMKQGQRSSSSRRHRGSKIAIWQTVDAKSPAGKAIAGATTFASDAHNQCLGICQNNDKSFSLVHRQQGHLHIRSIPASEMQLFVDKIKSGDYDQMLSAQA